MKLIRWGLVVVVSASLGAFLSLTAWQIGAQERGARAPQRAPINRDAPVVAADLQEKSPVSIQDALLRPLDLPFDQETSLEEVRQYLARTLGCPVVLDRAALDRLELVPEDTVQLGLKGVRLKVGLTLLLDQVGLAYRVVPEDNLLILTDPESSNDSLKQVLNELKSLHRELHDVQDSLDDVRQLVEDELGVEPDITRDETPFVRFRSSNPRRPSASPTHSRRVAPSGANAPRSGVSG